MYGKVTWMATSVYLKQSLEFYNLSIVILPIIFYFKISNETNFCSNPTIEPEKVELKTKIVVFVSKCISNT